MHFFVNTPSFYRFYHDEKLNFTAGAGALLLGKDYSPLFKGTIYSLNGLDYGLLETLKIMVHVEYDQKADALYIFVRRGRYDISEELAENVILDLAKNGRIIGVEVLDASKNLGKELVAKILYTEKAAIAT